MSHEEEMQRFPFPALALDHEPRPEKAAAKSDQMAQANLTEVRRLLTTSKLQM